MAFPFMFKFKYLLPGPNVMFCSLRKPPSIVMTRNFDDDVTTQVLFHDSKTPLRRVENVNALAKDSSDVPLRQHNQGSHMTKLARDSVPQRLSLLDAPETLRKGVHRTAHRQQLPADQPPSRVLAHKGPNIAPGR